jgi:hypothetical protein
MKQATQVMQNELLLYTLMYTLKKTKYCVNPPMSHWGWLPKLGRSNQVIQILLWQLWNLFGLSIMALKYSHNGYMSIFMTYHINTQKISNLGLNHKDKMTLLLNISWIQKSSNTTSYIEYDFQSSSWCIYNVFKGLGIFNYVNNHNDQLSILCTT